jgi:hypothetical protein
LLTKITKMEIRRAFFRRQALVAFLIMSAFFIQGFEAYRPGPLVPVTANHNFYFAFLYAHGNGASGLLPLVFALIVSLAAGNSLAWDKKSGFIQYVLMRTSYKTYIVGKMVSASVVSFVFVFISELFCFVLAAIQFPNISDINKIHSSFIPKYAGSLFIDHPFLYILLIIFNSALSAVFISMVSVFVSTTVKNIYIVVATPWLLFIVLHFVLYSINLTRYAPLDLVGAYILNHFSYRTLEIPFIWIVLSIVFYTLTYFFFARNFKARVYNG